MLAAAGLYSLLPLMLDLSPARTGGGGLLVFLGAWWAVDGLVRAGVGLRPIRAKAAGGTPPSRGDLARAVPWWGWLFGLFGLTDWLLFAAAVRYVETAVVSVIAESWIAVLVFARVLVPRFGDKPRPGIVQSALLMAVAAGIALLVLSGGATGDGSNLPLGVTLACGSMIAGALLSIGNLRAGEATADALIGDGRFAHMAGGLLASVRLRGSTLAYGAGNTVAGSAVLLLGLQIDSGQVVTLVLFGCATGAITGAAAALFTHANHLSGTDIVNSLWAAAPLLGTCWLWMFTEIDVEWPLLFAVGVTVVVASNMGLHCDPASRRSLSGTAP